MEPTSKLYPRHDKTNERRTMEIDEMGRKIFDNNRGTKKWAIIRDYASKRNYMVRWAACGAGCKCDAVYKEI